MPTARSDADTLTPSLNIINSVGQLLGMPFCAFLCDYLGRKKTLLLGAAILLIGGILQAAAQNSE